MNNNIKLVYLVASRLNVLNDEDAIQEGFCGLCIASTKYNENISKFSTFAVHFIKGYIKHYLRILRMNNFLHDINFEIISNNIFNETDEYDIESDIKHILSKHNENVNTIFHMICEGFTQKQISDKINISQPEISRYINKIRYLIKRRNYG